MAQLDNVLTPLGAASAYDMSMHQNAIAAQIEEAKETAWRLRQKSTAYAVGDKVIVPGKSNFDKLLECTTAGTTSNAALSYNGLTVGGTVSDGGVTWTCRTQITDISGKENTGVAAGLVSNHNNDDDAHSVLFEAKAPLASPTFTGTPTAPTAAVGSSNTQIATTEFATFGIASHNQADNAHTNQFNIWGLDSARTIPGGDANTLLHGVANFTGIENTNLPDTFLSGYVCGYSNQDHTYVRQMFFSDYNLRMFTRALINSSWSTWQEIPTIENDFLHSFESNGWQRITGGLIIQWGTVSINSGTYSFPLSFPTACASIAYSGTQSWNRGAKLTVTSTSQFTVTSELSGETGVVTWIAIGY